MSKYLGVLVLVLVTVPSFAQSFVKLDSPDVFARELKEKSASTETLEADFSQVKSMSVLAAPVVSAGSFYYMRPENISLCFEHPEGNMIVMSGDRFKIVSSGVKSVVGMNSNPVLRQMRNMFAACMTGDVGLLESGAGVEYFDGGDTYVVVVKPSSAGARRYITAMTLTFDKNDMSLAVLRMEEPSGDYTEYTFFNKRFNTAVERSKFEI